MAVTWVLEPNVLPDLHVRLRASAEGLGHEVLEWKSKWSDSWPSLDSAFVVFHGCLGTASLVRQNAPWQPGSFCDVEAFACTTWYPVAQEWLLHRGWATFTVQGFVDDPAPAFEQFENADALFVRPDSPLKPFSGRVVTRHGVSLAALDHGFYYEDTSIPIVVAPVRHVAEEWRYVIVGGQVVAGSAYLAESRSATADDPRGEPWQFAARVAQELPAPEVAYVLDVCAADGKLWLIELNPFSGADLYACDTDAIAGAIGKMAENG